MNQVSVVGVFILVQAEVVVVSFVASDEVGRVCVANKRWRRIQRQPVAERSRR